jgi:catechol 2,3-dioxygenase-like lactoylglutathione lyase family enzyme
VIDGVGGAFVFSNDAERLAAWYRDKLGLSFERAEDGGAFYKVFWGVDPDDPGRKLDTTFSIMQATIELPRHGGGPEPESMYGDQAFMVNLRVRDMEAVLERLASKGIEPVRREDYDCGRFAWIRDADDNRIELYESLQS